MWIIRWILGALFVLLIIWFAMQNTEATVVVKFIKWQTVGLPLWVVMYLSFAAGVLTWLIVSVIRVVALKNETRKVKKENKRLQEELNRLRNVSVEEEGTEERRTPNVLPSEEDESDSDWDQAR
jgi:uncharacterized integral membrane protein